MGLLSKLFGYSKNRKNNNRELLKESKSDKTENKENKKRRKFMENEKTVNNEVETKDTNTAPAEEVKEETKTETKEETKTETKPANDGNDTNVDTKDEGNEQLENQDAQPAQDGQVQETEVKGNGINVNDLVTRDELAERFAALEAKFEAVVKENQDLKDKYENKDFGNYQKQGVLENEQPKYQDFDSYSKNFM